MRTRDLVGRACRKYVGSSQSVYRAIGTLLPWLAWSAAVLCALGLLLGTAGTPVDSRHGRLFPILFVHLPAAWASVVLYLLMAFSAGAGLLLRERLFAMAGQAIAPTGALFALMALWTGSLWGKPSWGTWWDARLVAELAILLLYVAIMALRIAIEDGIKADRMVARVALAGLVAVPGFLWVAASWRTFHRPALVPQSAAESPTLLAGLLALVAGFLVYATFAALKRLRCAILEREREHDWVERQSDWVSRHRAGGRT